MSLYRHVRELLDVPTATTEDQTGKTWLVLPSDADPTPDHELELRLWVQPPTPPPVTPVIVVPGTPVCAPVSSVPVVGEPVPTAIAPAPTTELEPDPEPSPEAQVIVETSVDKISWLPLHEPITVGNEPVLTDIVVAGPYVRAKTVANGVAHTTQVHLMGNASFKLELV